MVPLFSIVIPTKNRPNLLKDAVLSVLFQDFKDYELIVSDNSSNNATKLVISDFVKFKQLKYLRPPVEMNMPTHFEWATKQATGKYVLLLTDRSVLVQGALSKLSNLINKYKTIQVIVYPWLLFDEKRRIFCGTKFSKIDAGYRTSSTVLAKFLKEPGNFYGIPRGLNTCYSTRLAECIRKKYGQLFMLINPDFTFAFLTLSQVDKILFVDEPLFISQGLSVSTGRDASSSKKYLQDCGVSNLSYVPLKAFLCTNTIFEDFFKIKKLADGNLSSLNINWEAYFITYYKELLYNRISFNQQDFKGFIEEFYTALKQMDINTQNRIRHKILKYKRLSYLRMCLQKYNKIYECAIGIKRKLDFLKIKGLRRPYKNVLEAAGFNKGI